MSKDYFIILIVRIFFSFFATLGFAGLFNVNKRDFFHCSLVGMTGWAVYTVFEYAFIKSAIWANFPAVLVVALIGEIFARRFKKPATLYIIPGIICFVPGYGIYNALKFMGEGNYELGSKAITDTILIAWIISLALIIVSSIFKIWPRILFKIKSKK